MPPPPARPPATPDRAVEGQAAAELVAVLPAALVVLAVAWQGVLAGHAAWSAAVAARAGARAEAVGGDPRAAVLAHLPARLERGAQVRAGSAGGATVRVRVRIPGVVPGLRLGTVGASAGFAEQGA